MLIPNNVNNPYHFLPNEWAYKPYCSNDYEKGLNIRPLNLAKEYKYIQPNANNVIFRLCYDIDYESQVEDFSSLPEPEFVNYDRNSGRCHLSIALQIPVLKRDHNGLDNKSFKLLKGIDNALSIKLKSDASLINKVIKNPIHPEWDSWISDRKVKYSLKELAEEWISPIYDYQQNKEVDSGLPIHGNRNSYLFDNLRQWAYINVKNYYADNSNSLEVWIDTLFNYAKSIINNEFEEQLADSELLHTCRSIARYTFKRHPVYLEKLIERATSNGIKSGIVRLQKSNVKRSMVIQLREKGLKYKDISTKLNIPLKTIERLVQKKPSRT